MRLPCPTWGRVAPAQALSELCVTPNCFSPAAEALGAPSHLDCPLAGSCGTSCHASCSWSTAGCARKPWQKAALSQAAPAHTCGCLEENSSGCPTVQAGQGLGWAPQTLGSAHEGPADQGFVHPCSTRAALVAQEGGRARGAPGKAGWASAAAAQAQNSSGTKFCAQNIHLSWNLPIGEQAELSAQMKAIKKKKKRKHVRCCHCGGAGEPSRCVTFMAVQ